MSYFNQYQYDDLKSRDNDFYAQIKYDLILDLLRDRRMSILNAGCGAGDLSFLLSKFGHTVTGIDPSEEYICLAKEKAKKMNDKENNVFFVDSIESYSPNQKFDCVITTDVLEHIEDDKNAMSKLSSLVRPGGIIITAVPAMPSLFGMHDESLGHFRRYSRRSLAELAECSGNIEIKKIRYFAFSLIPVCWLYSKFLRKSYPIGDGSSGLVSSLLKVILRVEKRIYTPLGISLICFGVKKGQINS